MILVDTCCRPLRAVASFFSALPPFNAASKLVLV